MIFYFPGDWPSPAQKDKDKLYLAELAGRYMTVQWYDPTYERWQSTMIRTAVKRGFRAEIPKS